MHIEDLKFPENVNLALKDDVRELNPPQKAAVEKGLLEGKSLVIASPTASGKTFIAEMAILKNYMQGGKAVYIVPLKALASEKYDEFRKKYEQIGMKIAISIGDLDSGDSWLHSYDLIIASNEKMDSLLRHNVEWIRRVSLVIADEIHMLNDPSRGPTLEVVLTRLRTITKSQIIALSATIKNSEEIADWLGAGLVKSDYRPIKLRKGIYYPNKIEFDNGKELKMSSKFNDELDVCSSVLKKNKQALVFVSTRRSSEAEAEKISKKLPIVNKELEKISKDIESVLSSPTKQCRRLASVVKKGAAFHHAGLVAKQRKIIEENFRNGLIKFLAATPTLAYGVNTPAHTVIVRDMKRYSGYGMDFIPVLDVQQFFGRAGRSRYEKEGHAVLIAKTEHEVEELRNRYINGETEPIYSKLSVEPVLRMHVLALVASGTANSRNSLKEFFSKTFFAHQYKDIDEVMIKIEKILKELELFSFIKMEKGSFIDNDFVPAFELGNDVKVYATPIGKRVSQLYIDPVSANNIIQNFSKMSVLEYIMILNHCTEMRPLISVREKDIDSLEEAIGESGLKVPEAWDIDYESFLKEFKTGMMFIDWMNESGEDRILDKYNVAPGELYNKIKNAEWISYSAKELAVILGKRDIANDLNKISLRIKHGIKEELLKLVKIKGIGRVRARMLYKSGIKTVQSLKKIPVEKLGSIIGPKTAENVLKGLKNK